VSLPERSGPPDAGPAPVGELGDSTAESPRSPVRTTRRRPSWALPAIAVGVVVVAVLLAYLRSGSTDVVSQAVVTGILVGGVYGLVAWALP